jgi:hypothetical protein
MLPGALMASLSNHGGAERPAPSFDKLGMRPLDFGSGGSHA